MEVNREKVSVDRLRATFIAGPQSGLAAQEVFANRTDELESFQRSLEHMASPRDDARRPPALDVTRPRTNVLVYYGFGGIGKTALSRRLELLFAESTRSSTPFDRRVAIRIDFGESGEFDVEALLLAIRAELSVLSSSWPAFDLAFSLYWARAHPGESLPDFVQGHSRLRQRARRTDFAEQMQDTFAAVISEIGSAWAPVRIAARIATLTHERLSTSRTYRRLTEECPFFEPLVSAEATTDALSYMASLISWEFDRLTEDDPADVVVFFDTFEAVGDRANREIERLVQRVVFLTPDFLHVITTRNRLDWADLATTNELDYTGTRRWPMLHTDNRDAEPRQHLVGELSETDCEHYLVNALTDQDGNPALGEDVRRRIVAGSGGLPLYLDLSVTQFLELSATGEPADPAVFGESLSSIVTRIMRDLDTDERNILRGVSLLDSFDLGLARAASGSTDAAINRFLGCSLVDRVSGLAWPYTLHAQLKRCVQEKDHELRDAWSPHEWSLAAQRVCDHLREVGGRALENRDRVRVGACLTQAVRLALRHRVDTPWIFDHAQYLADAGSWDVLRVREAANVPPSSPGAWLVHGLRGIALRRGGSLEASVESFDRALAHPEPDEHARGVLRLHRTHSLRNSGRYEEARLAYAQMASEGGPPAVRANLQLADLNLLRGEFSAAVSALGKLPHDDPHVVGDAWRIRGHVHRVNCELDEAELVYRRVLDLGRATRSPALEGKALTNLAETLCWNDPEAGLRYAREAIDFNDAIGNQLEVLKAFAALAVAATGTESDNAVREAIRLAGLCRYRAGTVFAQAARLFHQARTHDDEAARHTFGRIRDLTEELGVYAFWDEIGGWWLASGLPVRADWSGSAEQARQRWLEVLRKRED